jgi:hypothetical protein
MVKNYKKNTNYKKNKQQKGKTEMRDNICHSEVDDFNFNFNYDDFEFKITDNWIREFEQKLKNFDIDIKIKFLE